MRAAIVSAVLAFLAALGFFYLTVPGEIAKYGIFGAVRASSYLGLLAGAAVYAWRRGGGPERAVAIVLLADVLLDPLLHLFLAKRFTTVDPTHLVLGIAYLIAFVSIALKANRLWTLWLCAFHGLSVLSHVTKALDLGIHPVIYAVMQVIWSYVMLGLLIFGTRNHQRRSKTALGDASWSGSLLRSDAAPAKPPGG